MTGVEPLPDGTTLVHIGPYKTGTTAMQGALWEARDALATHGVAYPGELAHEMNAAMAVALGRVDPGKDIDAFRERWYAMVGALQDARPRVGVLSSEVYCEATDDGARTVLDVLGPQTHVVITVRPIVRLLGSQWQQYGQNVPVPSYDDWLRAILDAADAPDGGTVTPSFWQRHRHDRLVERWVGLVGADRVTVIVVDDRDHRGLPAAFEGLLGLPDGLLRPPADKTNRSLTFAEATLMQELVDRTSQPPWTSADHGRFIRFGAARGLQAAPPDPAAEKLLTPGWAIDRALEVGAAMAQRIGASGARVIGDLGLLSDRALAPAEGENAPVTAIDPGAAAALAAGIISKLTGVHPRPEHRDLAGPVERAVWSRHRAVTELWDAERDLAGARRTAARELARRARRRLGGD
ncbi:hypothetical protein [Nocardioides daeguensis]|uniref:Sulfotransferase family protein n=1 Tax=Nocardioides daeguensis TaxID=908359 RepID=A0ABP6UPV3_9ACTN|nr:hypothetical protein [Nocardioides daeguensis]MBV6728611.1 hypothetical protein [Nocardioides daeguensis]MCR1773780.1 hypothetical protein [Nocardioides daeguensis]